MSGIDTGYAPTGGIIPCLGEAELEARAQFIEKLRAETEDGTYPASVLSRKELEGMLPKVPFGPEVSGGIWSDMDGYVDPLHLMSRSAKLRQARRHAVCRGTGFGS